MTTSNRSGVPVPTLNVMAGHYAPRPADPPRPRPADPIMSGMKVAPSIGAATMGGWAVDQQTLRRQFDPTQAPPDLGFRSTFEAIAQHGVAVRAARGADQPLSTAELTDLVRDMQRQIAALEARSNKGTPR